MWQFAEASLLIPAPFRELLISLNRNLAEVVGYIRMHSGCLYLRTVLLKDGLAELAMEEVQLRAAALEVTAQTALNAQGCNRGVRAKFAGEQIGQFVAGHADAAVGQIQAPPLDCIPAEDLQPLQHPPEEAHSVGVVPAAWKR